MSPNQSGRVPDRKLLLRLMVVSFLRFRSVSGMVPSTQELAGEHQGQSPGGRGSKQVTDQIAELMKQLP